ncbi:MULTISPECIES: FAD-dependent oxidoreductase [unclassified Actinopolyspora]|uniref:NAD(P)/FAD-dependent oxidoreductase n=1 Tax=unclassified Actinopolyspora TaxID=2639451 RepID=UPI0013F64070|nr:MULTISPECIES: FAD-dependent oxidoreductase [unclassified Actinopolyspora]NHD16175.1 NAD(P)-binding protein [Actinopolyspora sp. BKK2]NHE74611.1 NAD(P)-binding protein [Actinopolyspora sp. BKK1]
MTEGTVAVIGAGVSGLTAAYLLRHRYGVLLFDVDDRLGGHAHTHRVRTADGRTIGVDSGFIVHNERTYPNLLRLFDELGVTTRETEMSMSVSCSGCGLEYAGAKGIDGLLARRSNLLRPAYLHMLPQVRRFHRQANELLDSEADERLTLGRFLAAGGYSRYFVEHFAVPLVSAVWSSGTEVSEHYPARYLFEFLRNHGMLSVGGSPTWRTVVGGSREYVDRIAERVHAVRVSTGVRAVHRTPDGVRIHDENDAVHTADRAVIATHADDALRMLATPSDDERELLGSFDYSHNETVLHTDSRALPETHRARASWNYHKPSCSTSSGGVGVSYDMNRLMRLAEPEDYVVTLGAADRIDASAVLARMTYRHPIYTPESVAAQRRLPELGDGRVRFAGAYHGWGFHEDGCVSGVRAAEAFGAGWRAQQ